jgi:transposase InsO family protein
MRAQQLTDALKQALDSHSIHKGLILQSDSRRQQGSGAYWEILVDAGMS